jgi:hypothetical protein
VSLPNWSSTAWLIVCVALVAVVCLVCVTLLSIFVPGSAAAQGAVVVSVAAPVITALLGLLKRQDDLQNVQKEICRHLNGEAAARMEAARQTGYEDGYSQACHDSAARQSQASK